MRAVLVCALAWAMGWFRRPLGLLLLAAAASGLCALFLHPQGFLVFGGLIAIMAVGILWPWVSVRGLSGRLECEPARCREGEPVVLRLYLENRLPWSVWGIALRGGFAGGEHERRGEPALPGLSLVPGRRAVVETLPFTPPCRGVYPTEAPRLVCGFPFGLWEAGRRLSVSAPLLVWPRTYRVARLPESGGVPTWSGPAQRNRPGLWGDPMGVRGYRRGDSLRLVHWALTARHGELIVREVQSAATARVLIALDADPASHPAGGPSGSLEWAIRVAASLAEGWVGQGGAVDLLLETGLVSTRAGGRPSDRLAPLMDALARFPATGSRPLSSIQREACRLGAGYGVRVIVTTDLGLARAGTTGWPSQRIRYVALRSSGFAAGVAERAATDRTSGACWEIEGPEQVCRGLSPTWQEGDDE